MGTWINRSVAYDCYMNDDPQTDLLKHLATISTGTSVMVVALRSELAGPTLTGREVEHSGLARATKLRVEG